MLLSAQLAQKKDKTPCEPLLFIRNVSLLVALELKVGNQITFINRIFFLSSWFIYRVIAPENT